MICKIIVEFMCFSVRCKFKIIFIERRNSNYYNNKCYVNDIMMLFVF